MSKNPIPIKPIDFGLAERAVQEFSVERNIPTQVYPLQDQPAGEGKGVAKPTAPLRKFTVNLPDYVVEAVAARAFQAQPRQTARFVVLQALQAIGIEIADQDMFIDGRRRDL